MCRGGVCEACVGALEHAKFVWRACTLPILLYSSCSRHVYQSSCDSSVTQPTIDKLVVAREVVFFFLVKPSLLIEDFTCCLYSENRTHETDQWLEL